MNYQMINKQSGSVLVISLVLLTVITLLAVMNMQRAGLQTRITSNILHREELFNGALNEQEYWFAQLHTAEIGDPMLSEPIRTFTPGANGTPIYEPVDMDTINSSVGDLVQVTNTLLLLSATPGVNALAQGEESGDRVLFKYELQSTAGIANRVEGRAMSEIQVTGMSFPGIQTSKNSLYSPP